MDESRDPITVEDHIDFKPGTPQAKALCFLYTNSEYGFLPAEVAKHSSISAARVEGALIKLKQKDLIGETADGYYHALNDEPLAAQIPRLTDGEDFTLDVGKAEFPNDI